MLLVKVAYKYLAIPAEVAPLLKDAKIVEQNYEENRPVYHLARDDEQPIELMLLDSSAIRNSKEKKDD